VTQCRYVSDSIIYMKPNLINMKNIIHSVSQTDFEVIIRTKSNVVKVYKFDTIGECNEYYKSITQ